jgi:dTDP-4-amino-4,6-dideoxy-D-galactose acyltransferase
MKYKYLPWDSEFFGKKIGMILPTALEHDELSSILSAMHQMGFLLAYWPAHQICGFDPGPFGGKLVDKKTTFEINLDKIDLNKIPDSKAKPYTKNTPITRLEDLALASGEYSRFSIDPNFSSQDYSTLYKTWMQKSIAGEMADEILVISQGDEIAGMVTLSERDRVGTIGLIAVGDKFRGKKFGQQLVYGAQRWFIEKKCETAQIVTQGDNLPACNLYIKCGYRKISTLFYYHFWLK